MGNPFINWGGIIWTNAEVVSISINSSWFFDRNNINQFPMWFQNFGDRVQEVGLGLDLRTFSQISQLKTVFSSSITDGVTARDLKIGQLYTIDLTYPLTLDVEYQHYFYPLIISGQAQRAVQSKVDLKLIRVLTP